MAITQVILTEPPEYSPVYNKVEVSVKDTDSTDIAQPNYKFVFDLVTETLGTTRYTVAPNPISDASTAYGSKDFGQILEGFIEETIAQYNSTAGFVFGLTRPIIKFYVEVRQGWDVSGVFTVDPDSEGPVTSSTCYAWCASFDRRTWVTQINDASPFNTWICNSTNGTDGEFLTTYKTPKVSIYDLGWLWLLGDTPTEIDQISIKTYESDGTPIGSFLINTGVSQAVTASKLLSVAAAPQSLNNISGGLFASGSQPVITSSVAYYDLFVRTSAASPISETIRFTIEEKCQYDIYRVHFLNKLGGFDAFNFTKKTDIKSDNVRKKYNRTEDNMTASGLVYKQEEGGTQNYFVKGRQKLTLRSDYLTTEENTWLRELVESPQTYLEVDEGGVRNFIPIYVTNPTWEYNETSIDKLFTLELTIEYSHEDFRQRR